MRIKTNDKYISMVLKNIYENVKEEIVLSATLNRVYVEKISKEVIGTKINNQVNSMEVSINRINPKFIEKKSKNYEKIKEEMIKTLDNYEEVLKQFCQIYDKQIEDLILKKVELESKLLIAIVAKQDLCEKETEETNPKEIIVKGINTVVNKIKGKISQKEPVDVSLIHRLQDGQDIKKELEQSEEYKDNQRYIIKLEKEIKVLNKKINKLNDEKIQNVFSAMESENKALSTEIKKPRTFKNITKFFVNRLKTYNVVMKNIIDPMNQRIDEFKVNQLENINGQSKDMNFTELQKNIKSVQDDILEDIKNKLLLKKVGIIDE